jgi:uncharacterized protein involved in response to NO
MKRLAPYQIFFPIGVLCALAAVGVWLVRDLAWFTVPVLFVHSRLIMGGFLWSFIVGFLMTAVPRMSGTSRASLLEYATASALVALQIAGSWIVDGRWFYGSAMALTLFLFVYGGRRLLASAKPVPVFFSHIGIAMLLSFIGSYQGYVGEASMRMHLYNVGAVLLLVLGIGTRFFSFLSGLPSEFEVGGSRTLRTVFHGLGISVGVLLFLAGRGRTIAYLGLALVILLYMFFIWRVQRSSARPSALKVAVRIVAAMIPLSFFLSWVYPSMFVTWFHLVFIGCFALMTFSVATRVTLAHGSYSLDLETKSKALWWLVGFLALALVSRTGYGLAQGWVQKGFLHLAATFWIMAVLIWSWRFFMKIWKSGEEAKPAC